MKLSFALFAPIFPLAIAQTDGQESTRLAPANSGTPGFSQIEPHTVGIDFAGAQAREQLDRTLYIENGGVATGDINQDGLPDIFLCGLDGSSRLYTNSGDWQFTDASDQLPELAKELYLNAATFADCDGDGDLDLFCGSLLEENLLLLNDGQGNFSISDKIDWVRSDIGGTTSFALADVDLDGDLDLFTSRYLNTVARDRLSEEDLNKHLQPDIELVKAGKSPSEQFSARFSLRFDSANGTEVFSIEENGLHDVLYLNDGTGKFTPAYDRFLDESGAPLKRLPEEWGLTASFRDVDQDGDPDLYVCNDFSSPDHFWINNGEGYFSPVDKLAIRRTSNSSMGVDFADIDRDGHQDFFVVDMLSRSHALRKKQMGEMVVTKSSIGKIDNRPQIMQNTLLLNRGDNTWTEIAQFSGVKASEWSWSPAFLDIDLDGFEDVIVTTGSIRDFTDADVIAQIKEEGYETPSAYIARQERYPRLPMRNFIFRNQGDRTFKDYSAKWGFADKAVSGGLALADFDQDGDLDLIINNTESAPELYRNNASSDRIIVSLNGPEGNEHSIGAKIRLLSKEAKLGLREIVSGGSYASSSDTKASFPAPSIPHSIEVEWPDGRISTLPSPKPNYLHTISHASSQPKNQLDAIKARPIFEDISRLLKHVHHEEEFNDFARQPLLPNRLSQLGPGVTWVDIDSDGLDELFVPSGQGGTLALIANLGHKGFRKVDSLQAPVDQTTILAQPDGRGNTNFILGMSGYEGENVSPVLPFKFQAESGWKLGEAFSPITDANGPMTQADIDQDGDLDLFVGGRVIPGQYPRAATSRVYKNENGKFEYDAVVSESFEQVGLVSSATFADLDSDGDQDLVLAMEWGPVRVFENNDGIFADKTQELGLANETGWWNGVAIGDLDRDGQLDIVATNWGRNSKYEGSYGSKKGPLQIYYGDVDGNGVEDIIEAHYDTQMACTVPERGFSCSSRAMPFVRQKMKTFENFGLASLESIYGDHLNKTKKLETNTLDHKVFFRRGDHYEARSLPIESQWAPAFGVCIGDMDGDGNDDVFLAQNFFAVQIETPRNDGGRGLWLKGDGKGNLEPVSGSVSGVKIYGEQRGAALSDFNSDGRVDLAVAQNGAQTKLFINRQAKPGLRVRLEGNDKNPNAIGATLSLQFSSSDSTTRVISSGNGYWSQESATHVFGTPSWPQSVSVTWPDGSTSVHPIAEEMEGSRELVVSQAEGLRFSKRR
ncbi:FG-GAP-like repeat-containing protein [Pelagicoccus mobilis]|uniref:VCBS repeat-containing protein n=1 Tax=Pelagicoccus mobilis TaxID=415221 RepID=A0A934RT27_9BACT|nr:FG-GAP-like repeat-containing protein [Pelagicoccus mobilis]MBK1875923.1 VCBS repeat-containing protein [Pelagicoccus mobilis]